MLFSLWVVAGRAQTVQSWPDAAAKCCSRVCSALRGGGRRGEHWSLPLGDWIPTERSCVSPPPGAPPPRPPRPRLLPWPLPAGPLPWPAPSGSRPPRTAVTASRPGPPAPHCLWASGPPCCLLHQPGPRPPGAAPELRPTPPIVPRPSPTPPKLFQASIHAPCFHGDHQVPGVPDEAVVLSALLRQAFLLRLHFGPRQAQAAEWDPAGLGATAPTHLFLRRGETRHLAWIKRLNKSRFKGEITV